jgi:hypothetical protein
MAGHVLRVAVAGIGLLGPGLAGWTQGREALHDVARWASSPTVVGAPPRLPATERRRAGVGVRAAVTVADEACAMAGIDPALPATVFTSATGEPANCHALCEALATAERLVSPTRFTNSVHNAAAGYWHIAVRSMQPSTSLAAFDASAAAGLLEAVAQCVHRAAPVLLAVCDLPYPAPLHALRPIADVFAFALLLVPPTTAAPWRLAVTTTRHEAPTRCRDAAMEALRQSIPAARALPLLQAMARGEAARIVLDAEHGFGLAVQVEADR